MDSEFILQLATATGYKQETVREILESFRNQLAQWIRQDKELRWLGFGEFSLKFLPPRPGRNPRTGETIQVAAKFKPKFKFFPTFVQDCQPSDLNPETQTKASSSSSAESDQANNRNGDSPNPQKHGSQSQDVPPTPTSESATSLATPATPPPVPAELMAQKPETVWYMAGNAPTEFHPIKESELAGKINPETPLWSETTGWKLAKDIPQLHYLFVPVQG
ncbi:HU family DNA-binding protein [Spirulina sp. CS-785/01]|uniref:HU family DNA-binding protein n=1 Tax=Spirulina sp. CS-785/01 TaxID=3021716 RepID=UPI00232CD5AB|nr:HU family DNA-binding protein [Spirulina sp. CS-785/01]MDB9315634.1 HU family DNA-binding protein [Spirulina sp. CS-785/01]